MACHYQ